MKYVIANWKMNLGIRESVALVRGVLRSVQGRDVLPTLVVCPSFTSLAEVNKLVTRTHLKLGAQNAGLDRAGAFTGEIGITQLEDVGCEYAILGHSERRHVFGESDELVQQRLKAVLGSKLTPVVCVGESAQVRAAGKAESTVIAQLKQTLGKLSWPKSKPVLIAYEPIWAIGSGQAAKVSDITDMHAVIREFVQTHLKVSPERVKVIYGGSVTGANAHQFLREPEVDGLLCGGSSLKINDFAKVISAACEVIEAQT